MTKLISIPIMAAALYFGFAEPVSSGSTLAGATPAESTQVEQEAPATTDTADPPAAEAPLSLSEQWTRRLEEFFEGLDNFEKGPEDADALYVELFPILRAERRRFHRVIRRAKSASDPVDVPSSVESAPAPSEPETLEDLYNTVTTLFDIRNRLLQETTDEMHAKVTGSGAKAMRELEREIAYVILYFHFNALSVPQGLAEWPERFQEAPLLYIGAVMQAIVAILVFRWWRLWARRGIPGLRAGLLEARPKTRRNLRLARALWYLDHVRGPLEWLFLLKFVLSAELLAELTVFTEPIWSVVRWFILAWLAVRLLNAMGARRHAGLLGNARLRRRSLWLIVSWFLLLGLGLDLTEVYVGSGTVHAWVWRLYELLSLPVLLLLLLWWRPVIFQQLETETQRPDWVKKLLLTRSGPKSLWGAAAGAVYLTRLRIQHRLLRVLSQVEWGSRLLATVRRREVSREALRRRQGEEGEPISAELRTRLVSGEGGIVEKVGRRELTRLAELVARGRGGSAAIVAERGCGKSLLLQRLSTRCRGKSIIVDCPTGGHDALLRATASALGISEEAASPATISRRLNADRVQFVGIDNCHRLVRPVTGGQQEMDRFADIIQDIDVLVFWVFTVDRAAWRYISRARAKTIVLDDVLELPPWTGEQIGELIELRCAAAEIRPDFTQIVLPRRFDHTGLASREGRNKSAFFRFLWDDADGNPMVALSLWADCLTVTEDGRFIVGLPPQPATPEFQGINVTILFVLRVIIQSELATMEDIVENLRVSPNEVRNAIRFASIRGWIEEVDGYYRLDWRWHRTVTRVLVRQNLLFR